MSIETAGPPDRWLKRFGMPGQAKIVAGLVVAVGLGAYGLLLYRYALPQPPQTDGSIDVGQRYCSSLTDVSAHLAIVHLVYGWLITGSLVLTAAVAMVKVSAAEHRPIWGACVGVDAYLDRGALA